MIKLVEQCLQLLRVHPACRAGLTRQVPQRCIVLLLIDDSLLFVDAYFDPLQSSVEITAKVF